MSRALLVEAGPGDRRVLAGLGALLAGWLTYTRLFVVLRPLHATLPACPFLALTGHPCPLCGGTRSFAAMWRGDVVGAFHYHPLGPLLFAGSFLAVIAVAVLLVSGRMVRVGMEAEKRVYVAAFAVLVAVWAARLALLPLPASP